MLKCDGTDPSSLWRRCSSAVEYCRQRKGPALVHAKVIRPYSHSLSDDEKLYRPDEERTSRRRARPRQALRRAARRRGLGHAGRAAEDKGRGRTRGQRGRRPRARRPQPAPETATLFVYSPDVDPTSEEFDNEEGAELSGNAGTMVDLINRCMHEEMARDAADRRLRRGRGRLLARGEPGEGQGQGRRLQGHARTCSASSARRASSTRRSPRPTSSAAPSAWRRAASSPSSRFSSSTTSGPPTTRSETSSRSCAGAPRTTGRAPSSYAAPSAATSRAARSTTRSRATRFFTHIPGPARRLPLERARRERAAPHGHTLRRPRALPRTQAPLPAGLQQVAVPAPTTS